MAFPYSPDDAAMADRRLQVFHAVAKHLSFTKAAEALFMTQPAVTFQIRQLEEHFDTRLFDRAHGRIALTPAGQSALEYAERILALSAELDTRMKEMSGQVAGPLLIGASMTIAEFLLPQVLGEFKSRFPGVVPRLFVANSEAVQARIAERTLDLGFIEGESHLPSLGTEVCCDDELEVVCAPGHPLARLKSVSPQALMEHAYIGREPGSGTREVIDSYLRKAGVSPDEMQVVMELGSPEALKGLAVTGLGFAIMSRATVAKETALGQLARVPLVPRLTRHFTVVYPKERFHSRLVNSFVQFAKERLAAAMDGAHPKQPAA
jgi:DNA-binding transcriptional LysR family regulator